MSPTHARHTARTSAAVRPTPEQVLQLADGPSGAAAAMSCSDGGSWSATGHDDEAVWGRYLASSAEPYEVAVDLTGPAFRCTCASRKVPCKHALGLLLLLAADGVIMANRLPFAAEWMLRRPDAGEAARPAPGKVSTAAPAPAAGDGVPRLVPVDRERRLHERSERMRHGLRELDRWLCDRVRAGLTAPELSDIEEWDRLAARLVDAQCGGLANRVRRVASRIGQHPRWHEDVLEEMALLHALANGALRASALPLDLADGVHVATGLTSAKDDVLAGVPDTDRWVVAGESRVREDRITVQRTWLQAASTPHETRHAEGSPRWAMVLSFGAVGNEVTSPYSLGSALVADVHWYPGGMQLRALVGNVHEGPTTVPEAPVAQSVAAALEAVGWAVVAEPWLERFPMCIDAVPVRAGGGRWMLADASGGVPVVAGLARLPELVSLAGGRPVRIVGEWSIDGVLPLVAWAGQRAVRL